MFNVETVYEILFLFSESNWYHVHDVDVAHNKIESLLKSTHIVHVCHVLLLRPLPCRLIAIGLSNSVNPLAAKPTTNLCNYVVGSNISLIDTWQAM